MTQRVEKLVNGESILERAQIKMGPIGNEKDRGDNSPSPMSATSVDCDAEAGSPPFYIPIRRIITVKQGGMRCPACDGQPSRCPCS